MKVRMIVARRIRNAQFSMLLSPMNPVKSDCVTLVESMVGRTE